ncbi:hypothetical protein C8A05DRAFT_46234 [Staphylotrichum tortipilum]|uniref:DUF7924 domain-containing protein n=1 Tax=Staphylotrichum tortipilum TaxID=2831512 RepID=A0AAN6RR11_9PEZI|nr:hypothetical protein C8A05DRAFT_46234 [Staphylotrichum longicolle]
MTLGSPAVDGIPDSIGGFGWPGKADGRLVQHPLYRSVNLNNNCIFWCPPTKDIPPHVHELAEMVWRRRDSPAHSPDDKHADWLLELENNAEAPEVEDYFKTAIFPKPELTSALQRTDRQPMAGHTIPTEQRDAPPLAIPVPSMLYGYSRDQAFGAEAHQWFDRKNNSMVANERGLIFPFLSVQFAGERDSLWAATNTCMVASAACARLAERFNSELHAGVAALPSVTHIVMPPDPAFSIAMSGTEARLYLTWVEDVWPDSAYYVWKMDEFLLQKSADYARFRQSVLNIIEWGETERLELLKNGLDVLSFAPE